METEQEKQQKILDQQKLKKFQIVVEHDGNPHSKSCSYNELDQLVSDQSLRILVIEENDHASLPGDYQSAAVSQGVYSFDELQDQIEQRMTGGLISTCRGVLLFQPNNQRQKVDFKNLIRLF